MLSLQVSLNKHIFKRVILQLIALMNTLVSFLEQRLSHALPGRSSQIKMAPQPVNGGEARKMEPNGNTSPSSVLILLIKHQKEWELALTLRSDDIDHGGQISFPGGRAEPGEDARQTAVREAEEEIGVAQKSITIIGQLSELFIDNSNNIVRPVVGYINEMPDFSINPAEVEEVFTIKLDALLQKKNLTIENWDLKEYTYRVPYWDIHRVPLWGATAMMLNEFLDIYREYKTSS